jgi:hypothetical protein
MSYTSTQPHTEAPVTLPQPLPLQGDYVTQWILAIAILTKSLALLINVIKK